MVRPTARLTRPGPLQTGRSQPVSHRVELKSNGTGPNMERIPEGDACPSESDDAQRLAASSRQGARGARLGLPPQDVVDPICQPRHAVEWNRIAHDCAPLSAGARTSIAAVWVPLRHLAWAASLNAARAAAESSNRALSSKSAELSVLHLQRARFFSALGWALGGASTLQAARHAWLEDPVFLALRRYAEDALALRDPAECSLVLGLMLEGLLQPLLDARALRRCIGEEAGALPTHFDALLESRPEAVRPVDASTLAQWAPRAASAVLPVVERVWGVDTDEKLGVAMDRLVQWTHWQHSTADTTCA